MIRLRHGGDETDKPKDPQGKSENEKPPDKTDKKAPLRFFSLPPSGFKQAQLLLTAAALTSEKLPRV